MSLEEGMLYMESLSLKLIRLNLPLVVFGFESLIMSKREQLFARRVVQLSILHDLFTTHLNYYYKLSIRIGISVINLGL